MGGKYLHQNPRMKKGLTAFGNEKEENKNLCALEDGRSCLMTKQENLEPNYGGATACTYQGYGAVLK
ncbi:48_t:CDS:2 [Paraglomus occultum]|uniref:48_t:CDS:1 n=1 Tax=Paraglomus occultum TaxID=144539 RepID=A0A9N9BUS6_9GLOM|nr:48_t:CDS:2 [Paraglomus occultum]